MIPMELWGWELILPHLCLAVEWYCGWFLGMAVLPLRESFRRVTLDASLYCLYLEMECISCMLYAVCNVLISYTVW